VKSFALDLVTGSLTLYLVEERRACCIHVRDGEPAVTGAPRDTIEWKGERWSWELCRVCAALHTTTPEQRAEQDFGTALLRILHEEGSGEGTT
jgi:hypothetical protein